MRTLPIFLCDFYKFCHADQYDSRITKLVSYFTPRGCRLPGKKYVVNFGVQAFCKEYLIDHFNNEFFSIDRDIIKKEVSEFLINCLPGVNVSKSVDRIMKLHDLGYLPISLMSLPEGAKVELKCPNIELVTTHPEFSWIGGYIESLMSSYLWKPMIDASVGHWFREIVNKYYDLTSDKPSSSAISEFGFRGADTPNSGIHSGAAWMLSFDVTATCGSIPFVNKYYNMRFPNSVADVTEYYNNSIKCQESLAGCYEGLDDLTKFMEMNSSYHDGLNDPQKIKDHSWYIPDEIWENKELSINGKLVRSKANNSHKYELAPFDEGVVGKGLISTEHSVMCSSTQLEIERILEGRFKMHNGSLCLPSKENGKAPMDNIDEFYLEGSDNIPKIIIKLGDGTFKLESVQKIAEENVVKRLLTKVYPHSSFSMVSDSYDYWRLVTEILPRLKDIILSRSKNGFEDKTNYFIGYSVNTGSTPDVKDILLEMYSDTSITDYASYCLNNGLKKCIDVLSEYNSITIDKKSFIVKTGTAIDDETGEKIDMKYLEPIELTPATLLVRGDSGNPVKIVAGYINLLGALNCSDLESEDYDKLLEDGIKPGTVIPKYKGKKFPLMGIEGFPVEFDIEEYGCVDDGEENYYRVKYDEPNDRYIIGDSIPRHEALGTVEILWEIFGGKLNSKGYRELDPHIRAIYGDSITQERADLTYAILWQKIYASDNVALGSGSFSFHAYEKDGVLYPYTRDTFQCAMKATYGEYTEHKYLGGDVNITESGELDIHLSKDPNNITLPGGNPIMIYKDPKTSDGSDVVKKSMKGCCAVYKTETDCNGNYYYYLDHDGLTLSESMIDTCIAFEEVFCDGKMVKEVTFKEIRDTLNNGKF